MEQIASRITFYTLFCSQGQKEGPLSFRGLHFLYNVWQDAGIRTLFAATAARCATNELHTFIFNPK